MPVFHNPRYVRVVGRNEGRDPVGPVTRAVEPFAWAFLLLIIGSVILTILKVIVFVVGCLVVGIALGSFAVWLVKRKLRRALALPPPVYRQPVSWQQQQAFPPQQQAITQPPQTVNQTLSLPANLSADETIRVLREMQGGDR